MEGVLIQQLLELEIQMVTNKILNHNKDVKAGIRSRHKFLINEQQVTKFEQPTIWKRKLHKLQSKARNQETFQPQQHENASNKLNQNDAQTFGQNLQITNKLHGKRDLWDFGLAKISKQASDAKVKKTQALAEEVTQWANARCLDNQLQLVVSGDYKII